MNLRKTGQLAVSGPKIPLADMALDPKHRSKEPNVGFIALAKVKPLLTRGDWIPHPKGMMEQ